MHYMTLPPFRYTCCELLNNFSHLRTVNIPRDVLIYFFLHRHEARDIVRNAVHASEDDAVIFVGSGCTGAVHKLIHGMDFASDEIKPIVLVGPYEHHSNLLPWREIGATVNISRHVLSYLLSALNTIVKNIVLSYIYGNNNFITPDTSRGKYKISTVCSSLNSNIVLTTVKMYLFLQ